MEIVKRLRDVGCDREPFTPDHAHCICRLANEAADELDRLRADLALLGPLCAKVQIPGDPMSRTIPASRLAHDLAADERTPQGVREIDRS